jgi:hypothetical protein
MPKTKGKRKNFVFPEELVKWAEQYAAANNTTMTRIILDHLTQLRQRAESGHVEQI